MTIERILDVKGSNASYVVPETRIADVIDILGTENVGALVVSTDGKQIEGIISERDIVRGLKRFGSDLVDHLARDLMTTDVVTCTGQDRVGGVMALMNDRKIRHVPVVKDGNLAGIVSIGDIVKLRLDEVQVEAKAMHAYISGEQI